MTLDYQCHSVNNESDDKTMGHILTTERHVWIKNVLRTHFFLFIVFRNGLEKEETNVEHPAGFPGLFPGHPFIMVEKKRKQQQENERTISPLLSAGCPKNTLSTYTI